MTLPLTGLINKLKAGQNACLLGIGDSTYYGVGDVTYTGGWPTIFGKLIGQYVGCIVRKQFSSLGSSVIYSPTSGATGATLLLTNVGGPGTTFANDLSYINGGAFTSGLASTPPDAVILWSGINDLGIGGKTASTIGPAAKTIVDRVRTDFGSNPKIIIGNQNPTIGLAYNAGYAGLFGYFTAQSSLPLSPALVPGTSSYPNLWCLDSHQAFGVIGTTDTLGFAKWMYDGLHPNLAGYTVMAQWMFNLLVRDDIPDTPTGSAPVVTTAALDQINRGAAFAQTLVASGTTPIAWSIPAGSLPEGLSLNPATGSIAGIAKANGSYDFTVRASNAYGTADRRYTGSIEFYASSQLTGVAKPKQRLGDFYHPTRIQVRVGGTFRPPIIRD